MPLLVFFITLLSSGLATAGLDQQSCPKVDLSSKYGKVRDGGGVQWCWAKFSADLIGRAQGLKSPQRVSEIDVASRLFSASPEQVAEVVQRLKSGYEDNGLVKEVLPALLKNAAGRPSELKTSGIWDLGESAFFAIISYQQKIKFCLDSRFKLENKDNEDSYMTDYFARLSKKYGHQLPRTIDPNSNCPQSESGIEALERFNLEANRKLINEIASDLERRCTPEISMKPMFPFFIDRSSASPSVSLAQVLKAGYPVGIAFYDDFMIGGPPTGDADHFAVIAGSRWTGSKCEFLLRDSNGSDCSVYTPKYEKRCKEGYTWLTEEEVNSSANAVIGMQTDKK